jgi:putative addiction module component (TIGR02574 family)
MKLKEQVLTEALRLQPNDRADLAAALLPNLDQVADAGVRAAWDQEAARRAAELDFGKSRPIPAEEFWRLLRDAKD